MKSFIAQLAEHLYAKYGDDISSLYIMFPSRRARLFFADALSQIAVRPLWQPSYCSIDELMEEISGLHVGDNTRLITELYKIYSRYHNESFDTFYFWGEMLLADFDSIDKYLIDADMLFSNISDLKTIESDYSYLTPEQIAIIAQFWKSFGMESEFSHEKEQFIGIWKSLAPIYHAYRERLANQAMAYTGMIHREAAEKIKSAEGLPQYDSPRKYVIAGFNALSECEKRLFAYLDKSFEVDFFWDYDNYYLKDSEQEAGLFLRENVGRFAQRTSLAYSYEEFSAPKDIRVIAAPSDSLQCKYVGDFLEQTAQRLGRAPDKETAVVLTDENLLLPVLHSMPDCVEKINITMGYPLRQTLAYSFVERLIELQNHKKERGQGVVFYHSDVMGLLTHPYILESCGSDAQRLSEAIVKRGQVYVDAARMCEGLDAQGLICTVFRATNDWLSVADFLVDVVSQVAQTSQGDEDIKQRTEFFTTIVDNIIKLRNSLQDCYVELTVHVFASLLRRIMQTLRIPYEGEPLSGVQIMGILETRNLDFENVIILSVNDDTFPGNRASSSFIPYNLRFAYGLPTPAHHEGVYAYYFYRLLQRASNIQLVYCSRSDDKSSGEQSRYIHQLIYESPHKIETHAIGVDVNLKPAEPIIVEKSGEVAEKLYAMLDNSSFKLSPTAFYSYIECPLKFYFRAVAHLKKDDQVTEDIDNSMFGTIFHRAMELLYEPIIGNPIPQAYIGKLIGSSEVADAVEIAINEKYLHEKGTKDVEYGGNVLLIRDIIIKYINTCILPYDRGNIDFTVVELEKVLACEFDLAVGAEQHTIRFSGLADRVDRLTDATIRVIDYKTGSRHIEFTNITSLFGDVRKDRSSAVMQTLLYAMMINRSDGHDVQPALYYVRNLNLPDYSPLLQCKEDKSKIVSYIDHKEEFEQLLREKLEELFNPEHPFTQCSDIKNCEWCDFKELCSR